MRTHYDVLGTSPDASREDIRSAHRRMVTLVHPDRAQSLGAGAQKEATRLMAEVNEAWHVLSDEERRRAYDAEISTAAQSAPPAPSPSSSGPSSSAPTASGAPPVTSADPSEVVDLLSTTVSRVANTLERDPRMNANAALEGLFQNVIDALPEALEVAQLVGAGPGECVYAAAGESLALGCRSLLEDHRGGALSAAQVFQINVSQASHQQVTNLLRSSLASELSEHPSLVPVEKKRITARPRPGAPAPEKPSRSSLGTSGWLVVLLMVLALGGVLWVGLSQMEGLDALLELFSPAP